MYLQRAWNMHGAAAFVFTILLYCDKEYLNQWEQIAIDGHKSTIGWENMYNECEKAGSSLGYKHTEDALVKMRNKKMPPTSPETSRKLSAAMKARWGRRREDGTNRMSEPTKAKLREANLGKVTPDVTRAKQSATHRERCKDPEVRARLLSISSTSGYSGHRHSDSTKDQMSKSHRELWADPEYRTRTLRSQKEGRERKKSEP